MHRTNVEETEIGIFKDHFISGLFTVNLPSDTTRHDNAEPDTTLANKSSSISVLNLQQDIQLQQNTLGTARVQGCGSRTTKEAEYLGPTWCVWVIPWKGTGPLSLSQGLRSQDTSRTHSANG